MKILGIDVGGSGIKGAPVDTKTGEFLAERHRIPTPQPATPDAIADVIQQIVEFFDWNGMIGCCFPAATQNGIVKTAANIDTSWIGVDAAKLFSEKTSCKTFVVNDADAAGMAEMKFGAGKGNRGVVLLITVGTGLGTVIFTQKKLLPNTELGHILMKGKEEELSLEAEHYSSDAVRKDKDLSWEDWAKRFDEYLHLMCDLFFPDLIIIGGGASKKEERFLEYFTVDTPVVTAQLQNHAGIVGAALAAKMMNKVQKKISGAGES